MKQLFTKSFLTLAALAMTVSFSLAQNKTVPSQADAATPLIDRALVSTHSPDNQAIWDINYVYDLLAMSGSNGNAGVIFFNNEFWVSRWAQDTILLIDDMGNLLAKFSVPGLFGTGGNARSFTTDGTNIYAGNNTAAIQVIDPGTTSITSTIPIASAARSLTYDPTANSGAGGFWYSNFSTDITLVSMTGAVLDNISAATHGLTAMYGTAFDNWTTGGPYLWVFDQGGGGADIVQINAVTKLQTGVLHDVNTDVGVQNASVGIAGGVFLHVRNGALEMSGVLQGNDPSTPIDGLFGYDMDVAVGLAEIEGPKDFLNINPTVTSHMVNVNVDKNNNDPVQLQIMDASGKLVFDKTTHGINNYINVSGYDNGMYLVRVIYNGEVVTDRFVKM
jgi:hypothetical protein